MSLGYVDEQVEQICNKNNIKIFSNIEHNLICKYIEDFADIVVIHYWNFPLLLDFLIQNNLPKCRIITWFHNSGFNAPYNLPKEIIDYSDKFVFTSPISYELDIIKGLSEKDKTKLECIWSTGGVKKYSKVEKKKHEGFTILYAGTLDYSKISEDFIYICHQILKEIPKANFIVCGTGSDENELKNHVIELGIESSFLFTGWIEEIIPYFEISDVFLYPLSLNSFSTCEQILGEAMASGLVPIVFNNKCEMEIVEDEINGFVVSTMEQCVNRVKELYYDKEDGLSWCQLSLNAKLSAEERYSINRMISKWNTLFNEVIQLDKKERHWNTLFNEIYGLGTIAFIEALDQDVANSFHEYISYERQIENIFKSNLQWQSNSKGSIKQYLQYFPNDKYLNKFQKIMDEN
jgi:glycosyltransferase involved in cell wall biosynthesis